MSRYEPLKEYTPRTTFVRLSRPQQAALYALCRQQRPKESPEAPTDEDYGARLAATMAGLAPEQRELVEEVRPSPLHTGVSPLVPISQ